MFGIHTKNLRGDLFGGVTAGVVALPLALAFGEASGAGPIAGLYGAIIVGFFASLFGGTSSQISGPTGPMVVVFAGVYATLNGSPELVFAVVVLAGLIQILFGVLRFGQYIRLVPYPVVSGFMSGIGCIIIALQFSRLFGHEPEGGGTIPALAAIPSSVLDPNFVALALGIMTLVIVFKWPKALGKFVPAPLAALIIGTVTSAMITGAPILGDIPTGLPSFIMPMFSGDTFLIVVEAALILAVLGSIDSLLTSLVADNMTRTRHSSNKELIGQGIGNTVAGLFGGVPGAGATMRTAINIRTGGLTKLSGITHSILLLAVVVSLGPLASQIPHAVLAGILVKTGYDIIDFAYIKRAHKGPRWDLALMVLVVLLTVFVDLITAVMAGVVMAALAFVKEISDAQLKVLGDLDNNSLTLELTEEEVALLESVDNKISLFDFGGPLSFGAAADAGHHVREKSKGISALILDFSRVPHVDVSAARAVETIGSDAHAANKEVFVSGMSDEVRTMLSDLNNEYCLSHGVNFKTRVDAIRSAVEYLQETERKLADVPPA
ncbi:SulP family inorganic anion transporter [Pseudomonadales bacterium]|nr:SulP family inorganic anion transporter [Pseudomonadales bacterium]MDB9868810.1 SulP family inorganic anion transporter [Pseudomonadales bacterium]MDB9942264.1 SulP family inorganic anion transporter [Pseudomonadales bacterium]